MIYSYGCSFSTEYEVGMDAFWLKKLADHLGEEFEAWGTGGGEHHEAYHRLLFSMKDFKKGDTVIFQFSDHHRIGLRYKNYYITTAGIRRDTPEETLDNIEFLRKVVNIDKTDEEYLALFEFSQKWAKHQIFHSYWNVWNILKYLEKKIGIRFIIMALDQTWANVIPEEHYTNIPFFPIGRSISNQNFTLLDGNKNIGLDSFCAENKLTISDIDGHPNKMGHHAIANILIKHIKSNA